MTKVNARFHQLSKTKLGLSLGWLKPITKHSYHKINPLTDSTNKPGAWVLQQVVVLVRPCQIRPLRLT
jgi:hypothetical protein